jgi:hypothetical protein
MYEEGMSTWGLAEVHGVSQMTIRRWMKADGIEARASVPPSSPTPKGGHHSWGTKISKSLKGNPHVGQGNAGKRGPDAPNWKGGRYIDKDGRVFLWVHDRHRYVPRAVLVWSEAHPGEEILSGEVIHHVDVSKDNDVPENLVKMANADHVSLHRGLVVKVEPPRSAGYQRGKCPPRDELEQLYRDEGVTAIARRFGVATMTVYGWLDRNDIARQAYAMGRRGDLIP